MVCPSLARDNGSGNRASPGPMVPMSPTGPPPSPCGPALGRALVDAIATHQGGAVALRVEGATCVPAPKGSTFLAHGIRGGRSKPPLLREGPSPLQEVHPPPSLDASAPGPSASGEAPHAPHRSGHPPTPPGRGGQQTPTRRALIRPVWTRPSLFGRDPLFLETEWVGMTVLTVHSHASDRRILMAGPGWVHPPRGWSISGSRPTRTVTSLIAT